MNDHSKKIRGFELCFTTIFLVAMITYDSQMYFLHLECYQMSCNNCIHCNVAYTRIPKDVHIIKKYMQLSVHLICLVHCHVNLERKGLHPSMALMWIIIYPTWMILELNYKGTKLQCII
jgi:hypothetical protein